MKASVEGMASAKWTTAANEALRRQGADDDDDDDDNGRDT